jgi:hypothetical protein
LRSGASSLAFFNLKPSFHGRDDVLSLSMTWNVHIVYNLDSLDIKIVLIYRFITTIKYMKYFFQYRNYQL